METSKMDAAQHASRRELLKSATCGFGGLALAGMLADQAIAAKHPLAPRIPHFVPRAKRIIFLYMYGGPSQIDMFDHKPELEKQAATGKDKKLMGSIARFGQFGEAGHWISDLLPHLRGHADKFCMLKGMHTDSPAHPTAISQLHTGSPVLVRPSMGAWLTYGLGTENQNLPGFVTICPRSTVSMYGSSFLPAIYQGTAIGKAGKPASTATIRHLDDPTLPLRIQKEQLEYILAMNRRHLERAGRDDQLDGMIRSFELAYRMQTAVSPVLDISSETSSTLEMYGIDQKPTDDFGRQCLMARRLAESGVRFVQVTSTTPSELGWDHHFAIRKTLPSSCMDVDKPIAGLLTDLQARGLLDDTLVLWGSEFGRTPTGGGGREHNPDGFTCWLAGGGVKSGMSYGETDELGYKAITDKVHVHDLHATMLYLLGLDHERLTYRHSGRDFRLTDVSGRVVKEIVA
ncbi:MAG: DUF1501 domain-containing protein [Planctomycetaceae bacterium]